MRRGAKACLAQHGAECSHVGGLGNGGRRFCTVFTAHVAATHEADHLHFGVERRLNAHDAVFDDETALRLSHHSARGEEKQVGGRLAMLNFRGRRTSAREVGRKVRHRKRCAQALRRTAGGEATGSNHAAKKRTHARHGPQVAAHFGKQALAVAQLHVLRQPPPEARLGTRDGAGEAAPQKIGAEDFIRDRKADFGHHGLEHGCRQHFAVD